MSRLSEVLFGIAVGDAVGNPLEFQYDVTPSDVRNSITSKSLVVSDDTQMSLFCAESLWRSSSVEEAKENLKRGYLYWYYTQSNSEALILSGLLSFPCMYSVQAPGRTCITSLSNLRNGRVVSNDSKGNGTVMRCAPIAYWAARKGIVLSDLHCLAEWDAKLTHQHPYAAKSSAVLVGIHLHLLAGFSLSNAVTRTVGYLGGNLESGLRGLFLDAIDPDKFERMKNSMGGWVAEEALALAIGAVVCTGTYTQAITRAIALPGRADSDTVGGIAGGLAVAAGREVPPALKAKLNNLPAMEYITDMVG